MAGVVAVDRVPRAALRPARPGSCRSAGSGSAGRSRRPAPAPARAPGRRRSAARNPGRPPGPPRGAAEQRPVVGAQRFHLVLVRRRRSRRPVRRPLRPPTVRLRAQRRAGSGTRPRSSRRSPRRAGSTTPVGDEMVVHGGDVGEFGVPDPLGQRVPPGRAVAGRAAVVDLDDGETGVQPGRPAGVERVLVAAWPGPPCTANTVGQVDPRPADGARRNGQQRVDPATRARPPRRRVTGSDPGAGSAGGPQQQVVGAVRVPVPAAARAPRRSTTGTRSTRRAWPTRPTPRRRRPAAAVSPPEPGRTGARVVRPAWVCTTSSALPVGVEVGVQVAGQVDRQFGDRAGVEVPDQQLVAGPAARARPAPAGRPGPARRSSRQGLCRARRTVRR